MWPKKPRSAEAFEWSRHRLERLAQRYPQAESSKLTSAMVEDWANESEQSVTSRRNDFRATKKAMRWARAPGLVSCNRIRNLQVRAGGVVTSHVAPAGAVFELQN